MADALLTVAAVLVFVILALLVPRGGGAAGGLARYEREHEPDDPALGEMEANIERIRGVPPP